MARIALSTAGITLGWCAETTAGTKPATGYKLIPGVKETPDMNPEPNMLDATPLSETEWLRNIPGLKDPGGAFGFVMNLTPASKAAWEAAVTAYATAVAGDKDIWWEVKIPNLASFYFAGEPIPLGLDSQSVDSVLSTTARIAVHAGGDFGESST